MLPFSIVILQRVLNIGCTALSGTAGSGVTASLMISTSVVVRERDSTHRHACGSRDEFLEFVVVLPSVEVAKIDSARVGVP